MIRRWLLNVVREAVKEEFEAQICDIMEYLDDIISQLRFLEAQFPQLNSHFTKQQDILMENLPKVNHMLLEMKGAISMARSAIADRKEIDLGVESAIKKISNEIQIEFDTQSRNYFVIKDIKSKLDEILKKVSPPKTKRKNA